LGNETFDENHIDELNIKDEFSLLIYKIANIFNLKDENLMLLIQEISQYKDIVEFVYEIDKNESVVSSKLSSGIQIMTIFKSKGLEFDSVILLDRLKSSPANRDTFVFEYKNLNLVDIHYKLKLRDKLDKDYQQTLENEKQKQLHDEYNKLYVALTRAKSNLIICKKQEKSIFDSINLVPNIFGNIIKSNMIDSKTTAKTIQYQPLKLGLQEVKFQNSEEESEENIFARYYGIATHYCLEMMSRFDDISLEKALNQTKSRYNIYLKESEFIRIKSSISNLINNSFFQDITKEAKISKEVPILYNQELRQIDLLIEKDNSYIVIDYKTTGEQKDEHIAQVSNYVNAIKEITSKDVVGYICYIKPDKSVLKKI
jgi:exodeoxyribonuclease V beta subunit